MTSVIETTTKSASDQGAVVFEAGWADQAHIVKLDPATMKSEVISGAAQAHVPDITDDGKLLVWAGPSTSDPTWPDTYLRDLVTGEIRRLGSGGSPTWTFDEKALLVSRRDGVYRMQLDGSSQLWRGGEGLSGSEVADGTYVFGDEKTLTIFEGRFDDEAVVFDGGADCQPDAWDLSPDGRSLAFTVGCVERDDPESGLYIYDLRAKETRPVYDGDVVGAAWSPDGQSIATTYRVRRGAHRSDLWVVDATTGDHKVLRSEGMSSWPTWMATA